MKITPREKMEEKIKKIITRPVKGRKNIVTYDLGEFNDLIDLLTQQKKEYAEGLIGEIKKAMDEKIKEFAINNASGRESYVGITLRIVFTIDDKISQIKKREGMG